MSDRVQSIKDSIHKAYGRWQQRSTKAKAIDVGLVSAFTAVAINWAWPDMHKELEKWNPHYQEACYTHNEDADGLASPQSYGYIQELYSHLEQAGSIGAQQIAAYERNLERNPVCVGPAYKEQDVARWLLTGVTIVNEDYPTIDYAFNLAADEFGDFWNSHVEDMEQRLVYRHALLQSRFERAIEATEQIDIFYRLAYNAHGADVFQSAVWQNLSTHQSLGQSAQAYQEAMEAYAARLNLEQLPRPQDATDAAIMQSTMMTFLQDAAALNDGDIAFMRSYYPRLKDEDKICTGSGETRSCISYDVAPPRYVHSRRLSGELVAEMTGFARNGAGQWLDAREVESMLRDPRLTQLYSEDAHNYEAHIQRRIHRFNTDRHDTHRPITADHLRDGFRINRYHQDVAEAPRPRAQRYDSGF